MVELLCPHCGRAFPVVLVESRGWCGCGMDYELTVWMRHWTVTWTPDPLYTPDAVEVTLPLVMT